MNGWENMGKWFKEKATEHVLPPSVGKWLNEDDEKKRKEIEYSVPPETLSGAKHWEDLTSIKISVKDDSGNTYRLNGFVLEDGGKKTFLLESQKEYLKYVTQVDICKKKLGKLNLDELKYESEIERIEKEIDEREKQYQADNIRIVNLKDKIDENYEEIERLRSTEQSFIGDGSSADLLMSEIKKAEEELAGLEITDKSDIYNVEWPETPGSKKFIKQDIRKTKVDYELKLKEFSSKKSRWEKRYSHNKYYLDKAKALYDQDKKILEKNGLLSKVENYTF